MKERYRTLLVSGMMLFALYFAYDIPSALSHHISTDPRIGYKITLLYSAYSLPNIVLPAIFGWVSHIKKTTMAKVLCFFVFVGHLVFTLGMWYRKFKMMLFGRLLLGIGGESFAVIQNRLVSCEFKGKELAFSMGLLSSIARSGAVFNFLITPMVADTIGRMAPCLIGIILMMFGFIVCFKVNSSKQSHDTLKQKLVSIQKNKDIIDISSKDNIYREKDGHGEIEKRLFPLFDFQNSSTQNAVGVSSIPEPEGVFLSENEERGPKSSLFQVPADQVLLENPFSPWSREEGEMSIRRKLRQESSKTLFEESGTLFYEPALEGRRTYHPAFFVLAGMSFLLAVSWAPFYSIAQLMFQKRYKLDAVSSGNILAIIEGISIVFVALTGTVTDRYGFKLWFIAAGCILLIFGHATILLHSVSPYISAILLGLSSPLIACYWPCIPSLVSEDLLGTGFSIIYCILSFAFTFSPAITALLAAEDHSYNGVELYMITTGCCALFLACILFCLNSKHKLGLNDKARLEYVSI